MIKKTAQLIDRNDNAKEVVAILSCEDWQILTEALRIYCENNKRKKSAKKLLDSIDEILPIYD